MTCPNLALAPVYDGIGGNVAAERGTKPGDEDPAGNRALGPVGALSAGRDGAHLHESCSCNLVYVEPVGGDDGHLVWLPCEHCPGDDAEMAAFVMGMPSRIRILNHGAQSTFGFLLLAPHRHCILFHWKVALALVLRALLAMVFRLLGPCWLPPRTSNASSIGHHMSGAPRSRWPARSCSRSKTPPRVG